MASHHVAYIYNLGDVSGKNASGTLSGYKKVKKNAKIWKMLVNQCEITIFAILFIINKFCSKFVNSCQISTSRCKSC